MTAPRLLLVPSENLREVWPALRERIAALGTRTSEPWLVEDVFADIVAGNSHLWVTHDLAGFVVLTVWSAAYARDLHVWLGDNETEATAAEFVPQIREIARSLNCGRVMWESPRRWERALPGVDVRHLYTFQA